MTPGLSPHKLTAHFTFEKMEMSNEKKDQQANSPHDFIRVRNAIHCTGRRLASDSGPVLVDKALRGSIRIEHRSGCAFTNLSLNRGSEHLICGH